MPARVIIGTTSALELHRRYMVREVMKGEFQVKEINDASADKVNS